MKIFLDDVRTPVVPEWTVVRNYEDFCRTWQTNRDVITHISFDHDLGEMKTGYDALCIVENDVYEGLVNHRIVINIHTANPVGAQRMRFARSAIEDYWRDQGIK